MLALAMEAVAKRLGEDIDLFYITGLIHDWDFEKWPSEHPSRYDQLKSELGVGDIVIEAIKGHGDINYHRDTVLSKALLACDALSGLFYAYQKMVGSYKDMKVSSIKKKIYKEPKFAAKVNREYVITGMNELGIDEDTFSLCSGIPSLVSLINKGFKNLLTSFSYNLLLFIILCYDTNFYS
jgi:predicted hydrolase (HD superfamily)